MATTSRSPAALAVRIQTGRPDRPTIVMIGVAVVLFLVFAVASPNFLTFQNVSNLATQVALTLIVSVAMTFVITTGQIDLSVGSIVAFVSSAAAHLLRAGWDSSLVIMVCLAAGGVCGLVNGWLTAYRMIPPFIVTLATLSIIRGLAQWWTRGLSIPIDPRLFLSRLGQAELLGFSVSAWLALAVAVAGGVVLTSTRFGRYVTGIGSQEESVHRAGVDTRRTKLAVLVLTGLAAGLAGVLTAARIGSGSANAGQGLELTVITAVVLGGTNLFGGRGTMTGTLVGAVLIGLIANGLTLVGVDPFLTPIVTGLVLVLAITADRRVEPPGTLVQQLTGRT